MVDFASLKKNDNIKKLQEKAAQENSKFEDDDRIWKLTLDKSGNGYAVIRFLMEPPGEENAWVKEYTHSFQGPTGKWYIEKSLTTIGKDDPCGELNTELWDTGIESKKNQARKQKRKLSYYSNIYVIKDPANPSNEGKVFLFKYGKKIFEKITQALEPKFADDVAFDPFNFWKGANFKMRVTTEEIMIGDRKARVPNYDSCTWDSPSPLLDDDKEMEKIWKSEYSLQDLISEDKFKTYDELKKRLNSVLGLGKPAGKKFFQEDDDNQPANHNGEVDQPGESVNNEESPRKSVDSPSMPDFSTDKKSLDYFASLADEDDD